MEVAHKSARVTIYASKNRGQQSFAITFHSEGHRHVLTRRCFDDAFALAQDLALKLGGGSSGAVTLGGSKRFEYERATQLAGSLGLSLDMAMARFAEASKVLGGPDLVVEACRFYDQKKRSVPAPKMVSQVVSELIDNRRAILHGLVRSVYGVKPYLPPRPRARHPERLTRPPASFARSLKNKPTCDLVLAAYEEGLGHR